MGGRLAHKMGGGYRIAEDEVRLSHSNIMPDIPMVVTLVYGRDTLYANRLHPTPASWGGAPRL